MNRERSGLTELNKIKRIHLMGMGGAGMSSLAKLLAGIGFQVSGCDLEHGHYLDELDEMKIECLTGHSPEHIARYSPELLIYTSAVRDDNLELKEARAKGIKTVKRGEALSWLFNNSDGIGVAGAHGKTTTSSMISLILSRAGLSPTLYVGAEMRDMGTNAVLGGSSLFLSELDESDGSFELFHPFVTVITNIDWDHADHFATRDDYINAFTRFIDNRKSGGALIICAEDEGAQAALSRIKKTSPCGGEHDNQPSGVEDDNADNDVIIRYGFGKSWEWGAADIKHNAGGGCECDVYHDGTKAGRLKLKVSGEHNILNALAAVAAADFLGHKNFNINYELAIKILEDFHGAERRLQVKGVKDGVLVIDDYAHHPTEINATLSAVRNIYPDKRILLAYQPHRYTRTAMFMGQLADILSKADKVFLLPVFAASEDFIEGASSDDLAEKINEKNKNENCIMCRDMDEALKVIKDTAHDGDIFLTMGAGTIYILGERFLND